MSGKKSRLARQQQRFGPYEKVPRKHVPPALQGTLGPAGSRSGLGSDIRASGPVLGRCALCARHDVELLLSHTHPKWAARWAKREGGVIHAPKRSATSARMQDGYKHYMLCVDCEQFLGEGERTWERFSTMPFDSLGSIGIQARRLSSWPANPLFKHDGPGLHLIHRALLGDILKLHYAPSTTMVISKRSVLESVRAALQADSYSEFPPPTAGKWFTDSALAGMNPRSYAGIGIQRLSDGQCFATVGIAGITWFVPLEPGSGVSAGWHLECCPVSMRAEWFENWENSSDVPIGNAIGQVFSADDCPCGSGSSYEACCARGWLPRINWGNRLAVRVAARGASKRGAGPRHPPWILPTQARTRALREGRFACRQCAGSRAPQRPCRKVKRSRRE